MAAGANRSTGENDHVEATYKIKAEYCFIERMFCQDDVKHIDMGIDAAISRHPEAPMNWLTLLGFFGLDL